jgi:hypothetical protein
LCGEIDSERLVARLTILSSAAVCFLLSIQVYSRLTGYDLGYSAVVQSKGLQSALFFAYLNASLLLAAVALARTVLSKNYSIAACAAHVVASGVLVAGIVIAIVCYLDGHLGDLPKFTRVVIARASIVIAPILALTSLLLAKDFDPPTLPINQAAQRLRWGVALSVGLVAVAFALYLWDIVRPWPEVMLKQLLIVTSGLLAPAFVLAVVAVSIKGIARICAACGVVGLTLIAALL